MCSIQCVSVGLTLCYVLGMVSHSIGPTALCSPACLHLQFIDESVLRLRKVKSLGQGESGSGNIGILKPDLSNI